MNHSNFYDVIVVGAGPAGSMAALGFAEKGFKVLVLESKKEIGRRLCGEYLCPRGAQLIQNIGRADLLEGFQKLHGMRIFSPDGHELNTTFPNQTEISSGVSVNREIFDRRLMDHARHAGAEYQFEQTVQSMEHDGEYWNIETKNILIEKNGQNSGSSPQQFQCRLLVGADGRKSFVSRQMENDVTVKEKRVALHAYLKSNERNVRKGEMHLLSDGSYVGLNPIDDYEMNISVVCDGKLVRELGGAQEAFLHVLKMSRDLSERYFAQAQEAKIYAVSPLTHQTLRQTGNDIALVGDAAGFIDPLTGEGIFNAIQSAHLLTESFCQDSVTSQESVFNSESMFNSEKRKACLANYQREYTRRFREKKMLNNAFQFIIRRAWIVNSLGRFFRKKESRGDVLVGIIGNIFTPSEGIKKLFQEAS